VKKEADHDQITQLIITKSGEETESGIVTIS